MYIIIQAALHWIDGLAYSIGNWDAYPLIKFKEVYKKDCADDEFLYLGKPLNTSHFIQKHLQGNYLPQIEEDSCGAIFYKSPFVEYTPWITIPCNFKYMTTILLCESDVSRSSNPSQTANLIASKLAEGSLLNRCILMISVDYECNQEWTYIDSYCYRINASYSRNVSFIVDHPMETSTTDSDYIKQHLFIYLEYIMMRSRAFLVKIDDLCGYIERVNYYEEAEWIYHSDCQRVKAIKFRMLAWLVDIHNECFATYFTFPLQNQGYRLKGSCYLISNITLQSKVAPPRDYSISKKDSIRLKLSFYLSKSSHIIKNKGILIQANVSSATFMVYIYKEEGVLPTWLAVNRTCNSTPYILDKQPAYHHDLPLTCRSSEFACTDGTCILQHHHCDGEVDCPDATDEEACEAACNNTDPSICFANCFPPYCVCTFLFFQCAGRCLPYSKVCDGVSQCSDDLDENSCTRPGLQYKSIEDQTLHLMMNLTPHELRQTDRACIYDKHLLKLP